LRVIEAPVPLIYLEEERSFGGSLDDSVKRLAYYHSVVDRAMQASCPNAPASSAKHLPCTGQFQSCS
jgi:hypothetical protein